MEQSVSWEKSQGPYCQPERRRLQRNLPSSSLFVKIRESERRMEAGERELGFYLFDLKQRHLYRQAGCSSFKQFVRLKTGLGLKKAAELIRVQRALELLPLMDGAFSRGELYWSAVRAMAAVATPQTEADWVEFAKGHRVDEVERRVAASRRGRGPDDSDWGSSTIRYPYEFNVPAEVHQVFEALAQILTLKRGIEVTVPEALFEAAREKVAAEIASDGKDGKARVLPSAYRLILCLCKWCRDYWARTLDGEVKVARKRAEELLEGAEVLDLEEEIGGENRPARGDFSSEVVAAPHPHKNSASEPDAAQTAEEVEAQVSQPAPTDEAPGAKGNGSELPEPGAIPALENRPARGDFSSEVVAAPHPHKNSATASQGAQKGPLLIEHDPNLSTPARPRVPREERAPPSSPELTKRVLSRDGYLCRVPGCGEIASRNHHVVYRSHGGPTVKENGGGLCDGNHGLTHEGRLLISGNAEGELKFSDATCHALPARAGDHPAAVELEVEPGPKPGDVPGLEGAAEPRLLHLLPAEVSTEVPAEITAKWWLRHRQSLEYSEKGHVWVLDAESPGEGAGGEPAPEAGATAGAAAPDSTAAPGSTTASTPTATQGGGLSTFVGQSATVENLAIALKAARLRGELPPPVLLAGPPGLGKTTLAQKLAAELEGRVHHALGASFSSPATLVDLLSQLREGDVFFIDEIHRLPAPIAEHLYRAIDERKLSVPVSVHAQTRLLDLKLEPFLLVGATTEESLLPRPLHSRFGIRERLEFYKLSELEAMVTRSGEELRVEVTPEAARTLALGSRGTPRELQAHLRRARDLAQIESGSAGKLEKVVVSAAIAERALRSQGLDPSGLSRLDRQILELLITRNRPLGLRSLADCLGERPRTLLEIYEPYLFREGYLIRTFRGRKATEKARRVCRGLTAAS